MNISFVKEPYKHYHKHMFRRFQIFQNSIRSLMQHVLECFWPILKLIHAVSNRIVAYHCNPCISSYERDELGLTDVERPPGGDINVLKMFSDGIRWRFEVGGRRQFAFRLSLWSLILLFYLNRVLTWILSFNVLLSRINLFCKFIF